MGNNCNKGRLCECFQQNCRFSFLFDCYHSLFASSSSNDIYSSEPPITRPSYTKAKNFSTGVVDTTPKKPVISKDKTSNFELTGDCCSSVITYNEASQHLISNCPSGVHNLNICSNNHRNSQAASIADQSIVSSSGRSVCSNCSNSVPSECCKQQKMLRQRSASHCPNHPSMSDNKRRCCCVHHSQIDNSSKSSKTSHNNTTISTNGKTTIGPKNSISVNNELSRTKRASSLRLLNKRFNFPLVTNPKESERMSTNSNESAQSKRPSDCNSARQVTASAVYHHGSSANHQIFYHTGASLQQSSGRSSGKHVKQKKLNQLEEKILVHIFSYLTLRERFYYERVCRLWQSVIRTSFAAPASLKIGEHSVKCNCQCNFFPSWDLPPLKKFARDEAGYIIVPNALLTKLLNLCKSLRCINFSHCYLDDQALQIIMANSDNIQCLHLNDIRLEEGSENGLENGELSSSGERGQGISGDNSGQNSEDVTVTSAMSHFATEQLAVFSGLMRKLSTRNVKKPSNSGKTTQSGNSSTNETQPLMPNLESGESKQLTSGSNNNNTPNKSIRAQNVSPQHVRKSVADIGTPSFHHKLSANLSYPNIANPTLSGASGSNETHRRCSCCNRPVQECRSVSGTEPVSLSQLNPALSGKTSSSNIAEAVTASVLSTTIGQRRAAQRRREWSRHRSGNGAASGPVVRQTGDDSETDASVIAIAPNAGALAGSSVAAANSPTTNQQKSNSLGENSSGGFRTTRHLMSPNMAPNISSLQTDSGNEFVQYAAESNHEDSSDSETENDNRKRSKSQRKRHHQSPHHGFMHVPDSTFALIKMNDVQNFVEQEQRRRENRLSHLQHWKNFAKKLGAQIKCLSIGGLTAVDQVVIDLLLKYCVALDELRINNEIDILSYLTIIKHTVKRIYINCEHGIGLECVSLLAFRNYSEKVINLGRVDVPPDLIDSVISTIGSNFSNLRSLHLRLHNSDIDLSTPAALLFENLFELNLQFVSGAVDQPFQTLIRLGWNSVHSLSIQYASITEESVRTIGGNMPQLRKLFLHAVEFRCDHPSKRYGHRICSNCSHAVWKSIASLPFLNHLRLHRVIIDAEICKALSRMSKLCTLELQFCSNVNDNVIGVCAELARRSPRRRFHLAIVSRGFIHHKPIDVSNLTIDIEVTYDN